MIMIVRTLITALAAGFTVAKTPLPPMGYSEYYIHGGIFNDTILRKDADAIVSLGLRDLGYTYLNIDEGWAVGRNADGSLQVSPDRFPHGLGPVIEYIHSKGLKFGLYTDRGTHGCGGSPGLLGYEELDAKAYASWGVDNGCGNGASHAQFVKVDSCSASEVHEDAFASYGKFNSALLSTGRSVFLSLCGWWTWYALRAGSEHAQLEMKKNQLAAQKAAGRTTTEKIEKTFNIAT
eukprot:gene3845-4230_t